MEDKKELYTVVLETIMLQEEIKTPELISKARQAFDSVIEDFKNVPVKTRDLFKEYIRNVVDRYKYYAGLSLRDLKLEYKKLSNEVKLLEKELKPSSRAEKIKAYNTLSARLKDIEKLLKAAEKNATINKKAIAIDLAIAFGLALLIRGLILLVKSIKISRQSESTMFESYDLLNEDYELFSILESYELLSEGWFDDVKSFFRRQGIKAKQLFTKAYKKSLELVKTNTKAAIEKTEELVDKVDENKNKLTNEAKGFFENIKDKARQYINEVKQNPKSKKSIIGLAIILATLITLYHLIKNKTNEE